MIVKHKLFGKIICPGSLKDRISDYGSFGERSIRSRGTVENTENNQDSVAVWHSLEGSYRSRVVQLH